MPFIHSSDYSWVGEETPKFEIGNEVELKITELDLSLIFFVFAFFFSRNAMRLFTNDEATILEGIKYLKIVSFSYLTTSISIVYLVTMRSVERVTVSTITYATSFVSNFIINYLLIFGNFGFPKMGIEGAAIGTLVARLIELGIVFYYNSKNHHFVSIKWKYIKSLDPILKKGFSEIFSSYYDE